MKKKIFSILFALVLVLSFSLVAAVPAAASPDPRTLEVSPRTLPTIVLDGVIGVGEWGTPDFTDTQTNPGPVELNIYVENDDENLYIAAEYVSGDFSVAQSLGLATALNIYIDANPPTPFDGVVDDGDLAVMVSDDMICIPYDPGANDWDWQGGGSFSAAGGALAVDGDYTTGNGIVEVKIPFSMMGALPGDTIGLLFQAFGYDSCPVVPNVHPNWPETYTPLALPPFSSIQAAINAADLGDTVLVYLGTYHENVLIDVDELILESTVAHGANIRGSLRIEADDVSVLGFKLTGPSPYWAETHGIFVLAEGALIEGNLIDGLGVNDPPTIRVNGIMLNTYGGGTVSATIRDNHIMNVHMGIYANPGTGTHILAEANLIEHTTHCSVGLDATGTTPSQELHRNSFLDCGDLGVEYFGTEMLDATNNWWGSANGPEHAGNTFNVGLQGAKVSDQVDYVPWLDGPYPADSFAPVALDGVEDYSSIQAAIDAATGTTITCVAGTFTEVVAVNKSVNILGANAGVCAGATRGDESIVNAFHITANSVVVNGFQIEGAKVGGSGDATNAIVLDGGTSGHTISNNILPGPGGTPPAGTDRGIVFGYDVSSTTVSCNEIYGWKSGIYINPTALGSNLLFQYNRIHHNWAGIGSSGLNDVSILNNNFSHNVEGFGSDTVGVNVVVHFNNFCGNTTAIAQYGGEPIDAINNFWCHPSGPKASPGLGDPVSGNVLYNPWLLGPFVPGDPLPATFDKTLALNIGWTLVSTDNWIDPATTVGVGVILAYNYTPSDGWVEVDPTALVPVNALYLKTEVGGALGINYSDGYPAPSSKDLEAGWNLISSATFDDARAILSPLRYIDVGDEQGVGLATLVSQGNFNQHSPSFNIATFALEWLTTLGGTMLNPFDGYWVYMNDAKNFGVVPD